LKTIDVCISTLALVTVAFVSGPIRADDLDDLDVTMEVIDDTSALDIAIAEMKATSAGRGQGDESPEYEVAGEHASRDEDSGDGLMGENSDSFDHDEDFDDEMLDAEDDFEYEEGEAVDIDAYDETAGAP
jgi:hypothetical protein